MPDDDKTWVQKAGGVALGTAATVALAIGLSQKPEAPAPQVPITPESQKMPDKPPAHLPVDFGKTTPGGMKR